MTSSQKKDHKEEELEFGGPVGAFLIMVFSHFIPYYLWYCVEFNSSSVAVPSSKMISQIIYAATPTYKAATIYLGYVLFEGILAVVIPGLRIKGLPLPHENQKRLEYNCNAIQCWYITLITVGVLHSTKIFPLTELIDNYGGILTVAIIFADIVAVVTYFITVVAGRQIRMTGNFVYDFFMGAALNPRVGPLDVKMFAEARLSWIWLFLFTASAAAKQYEPLGRITSPMIFLLVAQGLYTNAIMKGEECIPTTWDIFYEKFGWMLCYWNLAGVPFVYCIQAFYLAKMGDAVQHPTIVLVIFFIVLFMAYYVWDTSQSQRNRFRTMLNGSYVSRKTFPQLPWGTLPLESVKYLNTKAGSKLLIDGWWAYARKIHYTADIIMALLWGLICGFGSLIPYFYFAFFTGMIIHRAQRDIHRCSKKYGDDWVKYCEKVPYLFIPYVY